MLQKIPQKKKSHLGLRGKGSCISSKLLSSIIWNLVLFSWLPRVLWRSSFSEGATYKTWMSLNSIFMLLVWLFNPQCLTAAAPLLTPQCLWRPGWSTRVGLGSLGSDSTPYRWTCGSAYPRMCQNSAQWWALAVANKRLWFVKSKLEKTYNVHYLCLMGILIKGNR